MLVMFLDTCHIEAGRLDSARYGVDAARKAEQVERFSLLSGCIRGVAYIRTPSLLPCCSACVHTNKELVVSGPLKIHTYLLQPYLLDILIPLRLLCGAIE
jgi:hypothetical protein